jgi:hypothetical protein
MDQGSHQRGCQDGGRSGRYSSSSSPESEKQVKKRPKVNAQSKPRNMLRCWKMQPCGLRYALADGNQID